VIAPDSFKIRASNPNPLCLIPYSPTPHPASPENAGELKAAVIPPQWGQEPQVQTSHDGDDLGGR